MVTAQEQRPATVQDYLQTLASEDPQTALQIAVAETQRVQALAQKAAEEYRAMAELDFDDQGRIRKANMAGLWRLARIYADSKIVPEHYRGEPANCFIACQLAFRWRADPMMVMQSSYIVHGRPGLEGKLVSALLNSSGKIVGRIRYRFEGDGKARKCTAYAKDAETGDMVESSVPWSMVEAEKWDQDKKSKSGYVQVSKWKTMPDVMFQYRAATFLVRLFYPEVLMGMRTVDELEDIAEPDRPDKPRTLEDLVDRERSRPLGIQSHAGPLPSDEELARRDAAGTLQQDAERDLQQQGGQEQDDAEDSAEDAGAGQEEGQQAEDGAYSLERPQGAQEGWRATEGLPGDVLVALESAISPEAVEKVRQRCVAGELGVTGPDQFDAAALAVQGRLAEIEASRRQAQQGGKRRK